MPMKKLKIMLLALFGLYGLVFTTLHSMSRGMGLTAMNYAAFESLQPARLNSTNARQMQKSHLVNTSIEEFRQAGRQIIISEQSHDRGQIEMDQKNSGVVIPQKPRTFSLVHVGKAGGMTFRKATGISCVSRRKIIPGCLDEKFKSRNNLLGYNTRSHIHLQTGVPGQETGIDGKIITSYIVTLRNPIDRIVSSFRFNHPEGCVKLGYDCALHNQLQAGKDARVVLAYRTCFPNLEDIELFAQSAMSPWDTIHVLDWNQSTITSERTSVTNNPAVPKECLALARDMLQTKRPPGSNLSPHIFFNYEYYAKNSFYKFPDKEIFGIRTKNEWEDMIQLDLLLGGSGDFLDEGKSHFHGKSKNAPYSGPPLSTPAVHKLCCMLWKEIDIYLEIWERALNFNQTTKQANEQELRQQCGVATSWSEWSSQCKAHIDADAKLLEGVKY